MAMRTIGDKVPPKYPTANENLAEEIVWQLLKDSWWSAS